MNAWIDVAGWTLVHFVWEGTAIAVVALVLLWALRQRSPQSRYAVACCALVAMLAAPAITAVGLSRTLVPAAATPVPVVEAEGASFASPKAAIEARIAEAAARMSSTVSVGAQDFNAWLPLVVMCWMAGVAVFLLRLAGGWWRITRLHHAARAAEPSIWADDAHAIASRLGLSRVIHVIDTSLVDTPTVIGLLRPVILLPIAAFAGLSPTQVEAILAHELAHIRRHDFLVNVLQTLAETMLFYHPAVWWLSARVRSERELCCDEVALSVCGDPVSYAEALVELESWRLSQTGLAIAATGGHLMKRVRRLLGVPVDDERRSIAPMAIAGAVVLVLCIAGASHYLQAAQPDADASAPRTGSASDPSAWSMVFNHADSTMRFIGFRGRDLIRFAYQIPEARVVGGPRWLDEQILNIAVTLDVVPGAEEMPGVVRHALEEKLQLKTHVEKRNFPVLALVMARPDRAPGPNLRVSSRPCFNFEQWVADGQPSLLERRSVPRCGSEVDNPLGRTEYVSVTMPQFAQELRDYARGWVITPRETPARLGPTLVALKSPDIVDRTGLRGRYDIEFHAFYPTAALMTRFPFLRNVFEPLGFTSVPRALEDQLGLKLVESEAPYDVIVIDLAEQP